MDDFWGREPVIPSDDRAGGIRVSAIFLRFSLVGGGGGCLTAAVLSGGGMCDAVGTEVVNGWAGGCGNEDWGLGDTVATPGFKLGMLSLEMGGAPGAAVGMR